LLNSKLPSAIVDPNDEVITLVAEIPDAQKAEIIEIVKQIFDPDAPISERIKPDYIPSKADRLFYVMYAVANTADSDRAALFDKAALLGLTGAEVSFFMYALNKIPSDDREETLRLITEFFPDQEKDFSYLINYLERYPKDTHRGILSNLKKIAKAGNLSLTELSSVLTGFYKTNDESTRDDVKETTRLITEFFPGQEKDFSDLIYYLAKYPEYARRNILSNFQRIAKARNLLTREINPYRRAPEIHNSYSEQVLGLLLALIDSVKKENIPKVLIAIEAIAPEKREEVVDLVKKQIEEEMSKGLFKEDQKTMSEADQRYYRVIRLLTDYSEYGYFYHYVPPKLVPADRAGDFDRIFLARGNIIRVGAGAAAASGAGAAAAGAGAAAAGAAAAGAGFERETRALSIEEKRVIFNKAVKAVKEGNIRIIKAFLEQEQYGWLLTYAIDKGLTLLRMAAKEGSPEIVAYLLEKGFDPNVTDKNNQSPLLTALNRLNKIVEKRNNATTASSGAGAAAASGAGGRAEIPEDIIRDFEDAREVVRRLGLHPETNWGIVGKRGFNAFNFSMKEELINFIYGLYDRSALQKNKYIYDERRKQHYRQRIIRTEATDIADSRALASDGSGFIVPSANGAGFDIMISREWVWSDFLYLLNLLKKDHEGDMKGTYDRPPQTRNRGATELANKLTEKLGFPEPWITKEILIKFLRKKLDEGPRLAEAAVNALIENPILPFS
tara:strand:- start:26714 stop:28894 length:2181 start_codon:yes stop_codon:yes gene_type:complete